jgi:hypothetical protein
MIRIPRTELDYAIATLIACGKNARNKNGLRVRFPIAGDQAERAILAALATLAPGTIPQVVMPMDVHEIDIDPYNAQHKPADPPLTPYEYGPRGLSRAQLAERYGRSLDEVFYGTRPEDQGVAGRRGPAAVAARCDLAAATVFAGGVGHPVETDASVPKHDQSEMGLEMPNTEAADVQGGPGDSAKSSDQR